MPAWLSKLFFGIVVFITNIIQTITGFAGTVLAMPFSISLVGYNFAKPILNIVALAVCVIVVILHFKQIEWKAIILMLVPMAIGMVGGYFLKKYLFKYNHTFLIIYGSIVCLIAILYLFQRKDVVLPEWVNILIMLFAGIVHFIFVSGGPLLIIVAKNKIKEKDSFRATLSMIWVLLNSAILTTDLVQHSMSLDSVWMLLILLPTVIASVAVGRIVVKKMSNNIFMKLTCVLLFISGAFLVTTNAIGIIRAR